MPVVVAVGAVRASGESASVMVVSAKAESPGTVWETDATVIEKC